MCSLSIEIHDLREDIVNMSMQFVLVWILLVTVCQEISTEPMTDEGRSYLCDAARKLVSSRQRDTEPYDYQLEEFMKCCLSDVYSNSC